MLAWRAVILGLGALLCGCPLSIEPSDTAVGAPCRSGADCESGYCERRLPDGYCTLDCAARPCPDGSRCAESFDVILLRKTSLCYRRCAQAADCGRPYPCMPTLPFEEGPVCSLPLGP